MADLPWDSSRCMRLLRPLRAHLAALEREQQRSSTSRPSMKSSKLTLKPSVNDQSPDWLGRTAARAKKFKKTYANASRSSHHGSEAEKSTLNDFEALDGQIAVPLSLIPHVDDIGAANDVERVSGVGIDDQNPRNGKKNGKTRALYDIRANDNVSGVITSYLAIDSATQPNTQTPRDRGALSQSRRPKGAASLRSMAIRALASFIEREAIDQLVLNVEDRYNVSEQVYADIDDEVLPREHGLCLQAQLIRAHATKLVCNALRTQVLKHSAALSIVRAMGDESIFEQEMILGAAAYGVRPDINFKNCLQDPMIPNISGILESTMKLSSNCYLSSNSYIPSSYVPKTILLQLLSNPSFPAEWLSTAAYHKQWQPLVTDIACASHQYYNSRTFMTKIIRLACGAETMSTRQQHALQYVSVIGHGTFTSRRKDCERCSHRAATREQRVIRHAFTRSVASILTIMTALVVVGSDQYDRSPQATFPININSISSVKLTHIKSFLHEVTSNVLETKHEEWKTEKTNSLYFGSRCAAVLMCQLISQVMAPIDKESKEHDCELLIDNILQLEDLFYERSDAEYNLLEDLPELFASICEAAAQISTVAATTWLYCISSSLDTLDPLSRRANGFIQQLCRETADHMDVSQPYQFTKDGGSATVNFSCTPAKVKTSLLSDGWDVPGYRWEPMLSEWVSATPVRPLSRNKDMSQRLLRPSHDRSQPLLQRAVGTSTTQSQRASDTQENSDQTRNQIARREALLRDGRVGVVVVDDTSSETDPGEPDTSSPIQVLETVSTDSSAYAAKSSTRTMIDVFVPLKQSQSDVRRISDFIPWSSPVAASTAVPSSSRTLKSTNSARERLEPLSPPPSPFRSMKNTQRAEVQASLQLKHGRNKRRSEPEQLEEDIQERKHESDGGSSAKRPRTRPTRKAAQITDTRRHSGRLQRKQRPAYDSEADELA